MTNINDMGDREAEDLLYQAEAALARGRDDIAALLAEVDEVNAFVTEQRDLLDGERDENRRLETEEEARARSGELGRARRVVQERIDADETTWRAVMGDEDQHWSAVETRAEMIGAVRHAIDVMEQADPEFASEYRAAALGRDPLEPPGVWSSLGGATQDGAAPDSEPTRTDGNRSGRPDPSVGQW